MFSHALTKEQ